MSNLSRIKPKLRTEGRVSGNFGRNKVQAGSQMSHIGETQAQTVRITRAEDYIQRIHQALAKAQAIGDTKLVQFCQQEIRNFNVKRNHV